MAPLITWPPIFKARSVVSYSSPASNISDFLSAANKKASCFQKAPILDQALLDDLHILRSKSVAQSLPSSAQIMFG